MIDRLDRRGQPLDDPAVSHSGPVTRRRVRVRHALRILAARRPARHSVIPVDRRALGVGDVDSTVAVVVDAVAARGPGLEHHDLGIEWHRRVLPDDGDRRRGRQRRAVTLGHSMARPRTSTWWTTKVQLPTGPLWTSLPGRQTRGRGLRGRPRPWRRSRGCRRRRAAPQASGRRLVRRELPRRPGSYRSRCSRRLTAAGQEQHPTTRSAAGAPAYITASEVDYGDCAGGVALVPLQPTALDQFRRLGEQGAARDSSTVTV